MNDERDILLPCRFSIKKSGAELLIFLLTGLRFSASDIPEKNVKIRLKAGRITTLLSLFDFIICMIHFPLILKATGVLPPFNLILYIVFSACATFEFLIFLSYTDTFFRL
jgi:hypothetical protein